MDLDVSSPVEQIARALIAADHVMRDAICRNPAEADGRSATHAEHDRRVSELDAELHAVGARIRMCYPDDNGSALIGVDVELREGAVILVGRKPDWLLRNERIEADRKAAYLAECESRNAARLAAIGMSMDEVRTSLCARAVREEWPLIICRLSAEARIAIVSGVGGAGTWDVALHGVGSEDGTYLIAADGVGRMSETVARWAASLPIFFKIAGAS